MLAAIVLIPDSLVAARQYPASIFANLRHVRPGTSPLAPDLCLELGEGIDMHLHARGEALQDIEHDVVGVTNSWQNLRHGEA